MSSGGLKAPSVDEQGSDRAENGSEWKTQIINNRYLNMEKLKELLKEQFGDNWRVQVKLNRYILSIPRELTEVSRHPRTEHSRSG